MIECDEIPFFSPEGSIFSASLIPFRKFGILQVFTYKEREMSLYSVLIVEDEDVQREFLRMQIPALDSRFVIAGEAVDGREALDFLSRREVDLLVTDIKMPVMNGLELCREAYAKYPRMRIVILSGYEEFEYARQALKYKAEQYLLKPLAREAMRRVLAQVADHFEQVRSDESALRGLRALSDEGRKQVARRLLQALIAGSQAEIGTLFPLTYRMKIPLFEGEGHLLLLEIDESSLRDKRIGYQETSVFHYILNQIASETAEGCELAWTTFDDRERTAVLLSGTETSELLPECGSFTDK
ncbi:response regulator [Cohnella faecalis]|uniref:Response regulator n=1 Tax=Cohnella faecalis TaxID=2315694 RepID=A0A398CRQ6_9BACL|nr:response regulator [Cohnella faecalis]